MAINITKLGDYLTRDGTRVSITCVDSKQDWPCAGQIWEMYRGKLRPRGDHAWMKDGRYNLFRDSRFDIVRKADPL